GQLGADIAAGTGAVLDDEGLPKPIRQPLPDQAGVDVVGAAGRKADDDVYRPRRIALRRREARHNGGGCSAGSQMQKLSAGRVHASPSWTIAFLDNRLPGQSRSRSKRLASHSGLMLANLMTLVHFSVSAVMNFWHSAGVIGIGMMPRSANRALSRGS